MSSYNWSSPSSIDPPPPMDPMNENSPGGLKEADNISTPNDSNSVNISNDVMGHNSDSDEKANSHLDDNNHANISPSQGDNDPSYSPNRDQIDDYHSSSSHRSRSLSPSSYKRNVKSTSNTNENIEPSASHPHPDPSTVLGVFGLAQITREDRLKEVYSQFGTVERVQIIYDRSTKMSKCFAFIYMSSIEEAEKALESTNDTVSFYIKPNEGI